MAKTSGFDADGIARARARGRASAQSAASQVDFHPATDMVRLLLKNGTAVFIPRAKIDGLRRLPKSAALELRVAYGGQALTIKDRDVHISVGGLVRKAVMGDDPFALAGRVRSAAKTVAARANGRRGGRPASVKATAR